MHQDGVVASDLETERRLPLEGLEGITAVMSGMQLRLSSAGVGNAAVVREDGTGSAAGSTLRLTAHEKLS